MKKTILMAILAAVFLSCGTPKTVLDSKKVMKGYWSLDNITYSETGTFNVELLNDASKDCFEGSNWRFIPNNNTGNYTIEDGNCATGERYFIFTIQEIDATSGLYDFLLKPTNEKKKSETNTGFRLRLASLSDSSMQWEQTVSVDGKPFTIYMNFSKISE
jgi:hypothetical protein